MPEDDIPFAPSPDRLSELSNAILHGDPAGAMLAMRKSTELPMGDLAMTIMALAGLLWAVAEVVKQVRPMAQTWSDAGAERYRAETDEHHPPADKPGAGPAGKP